MLSKQAFLTKHSNKYSKLSQSQKDARYRDYVSSHSRVARSSNQQLVSQAKPERTPGLNSSRTNASGMPVLKTGMSECARDYLQALSDPWDLAEMPCIPDNIVLSSYKNVSRFRGVLNCGLQGIGYVAIDPWLACFNNIASVAYTTSAFNDVNFRTPPRGGVTNAVTNTTLSSSQNRSVRVVGAGIRIRYCGPEISRGGRIVAYRQSMNQSIPDNTSMDYLLSNPEAVTVPVDRDWHAVCYRPSSAFDLAYNSIADVTSTSDYSQVLMISSAADAQFEVDIVVYSEFVGTQLPQTTRSHSDPLGYSVAMTALSEHQPTTTPSNNFLELVRSSTDIATRTLSYVLPAAKAIVPAVRAISSLF